MEDYQRFSYLCTARSEYGGCIYYNDSTMSLVHHIVKKESALLLQLPSNITAPYLEGSTHEGSRQVP